LTYDGGDNHDPDGDSDGSIIIVLSPSRTSATVIRRWTAK
jgi:hypothetical protein